MTTLEQIQNDIAAGKVPRIYFSSGSLWWTHSPEDVKQAMEQVRAFQDEQLQKMERDPRADPRAIKRSKALLSLARSGGHKIPLDPTGAPLYQSDNAAEWINQARANARNKFGELGDEFLMHTHHDNSTKVFKSWAEAVANYMI